MLMRGAGPLAAVQLQRVGWVSERGGGSEKRSSERGPTGAELIGLGLMVAISVLLPMGAGLALDAAVHTSPIGLLIGLVAGVAAAVFVVFREYKRYL